MARFDTLRDDSKYQVFLMVCPATLPFSLAAHSWLIVNRAGALAWYSVSWRRACEGAETFSGHVCRGCTGHLHRDNHSFGEGIEVFPFTPRPLWGSGVASYVEGAKDSLADRMCAFIEQSLVNYPYTKYSLLGPNSNTYPAWVVAQFPESGLCLPWNAVGKNYRL